MLHQIALTLSTSLSTLELSFMRASILLIAKLLLASTESLLGQSGCIPADSTALYFRSFVRRFVTLRDSESALIRSGSIFRVTDSSKVVIMSNATTCARVVVGFNLNRGTPGRTRRLHVVDVNKQGYFVYEPSPPPAIASTSWRGAYSMTKTFVVSTLFVW
jgi:hypothetical protein